MPTVVFKEIEKFIIRQPPKGEKDDYDSENSWISDGLPSSSLKKYIVPVFLDFNVSTFGEFNSCELGVIRF